MRYLSKVNKTLLAIIGVVWFVVGIGIDVRNTRVVNQLQRENRTLMTNNVNLIRLNEALSQGVSDVADTLLKKAEWDKQVAEKIRELDVQVKGFYGQTNQGVSGPVR